ncbi:MAG: hypothetical protein JO270_25275 [Acidobacteriaceae bacterium]|nr:hypothetical protein [Acidobacteriaceae bacterium]
MSALFSLLALGAAHSANAQITDQVEATIPHSFVVGTKTLPPGKYVFQMQQGSSGGVMTVTSADGKDSDMFTVRESQARSVPAHTELVFRRYGDQEFLTKIYEGGNRLGVAVAGQSKMEKELVAQGQKATEHTETAGK